MTREYDVTLRVYDLSGGMARILSGDVLGTTLEAVYHTGIVVHGREYWFGRGLQCAPAERTQMQFGTPLRVDSLGTTEVDAALFQDFLRELSPRYTSETYSLLRHNCNNFSDEAARFLVGRGIDQKILDLPNVFLSTELGKSLAPMLGMFEQTMRSTQGDSCVVVEDAAPEPEPEPAKPVSGIPELPKRSIAKSTAGAKTPANSASASADNLVNMVRSLSQTFNEYHERGENTQAATRAALSSALGELAKSQDEL